MAAVPFMPLYVADYMADAAHLSTAEHGAYLLLIMTYWQRGEALPNDDKKLARITGLSGRNWQRAKPILFEFFDVCDTKLVHHRVEHELSRIRDKSLKNRKGGLARAEQVKQNAKRTLSHTDTDTDTVVMDKPLQQRKRASRLAADWMPSLPYPPKIERLVNQWPSERIERERDGFKDYWENRERDAARINWDKVWHNRIRDIHDRVMQQAGRSGNQNAANRANPRVNGIEAALDRRIAGAADGRTTDGTGRDSFLTITARPDL